MARRTFLGSVLVGTGSAIVTCALVACSSLPDLHFADADGEGGVVGEGGAEGGEGGEGGGPCKGPEVCTDGVDNDCNLFTDCMDKSCTAAGYACETVPAGWTAVTFAAAARPNCPAGETAVDLQVAANDASATCACSCKASGGSCDTGNFTVTSASDVACAVTPTTTTAPVDMGTCAPLGASIALSTHAMATPPLGPQMCAVTPTLNGALTNGRMCQPQGIGGGCNAGQVCALKPVGGAALSTCVTMSGRVACPGGYTKRSTAGTTAADTRACVGCACDPPVPCTGGTVSLYEDSMCKTNGAFKHADNVGGVCNTLAPSSGFTATYFKSTKPAGGCGNPTAPGTVTGTVSFTNERTICCK